MKLPYGQKIEQARESRGWSIRKAAKLAEMSEGRLRQIEVGYESVGRGITKPVNPSIRHLRSIARVLDLDADELIRLAKATQEPPSPSVRDEAHAAFVALIKADPSLDDLSKAHIINQHALLQRVNTSAEADSALLDQQARAEIDAAIEAEPKRRTPKAR